jgi:hypothetical protein
VWSGEGALKGGKGLRSKAGGGMARWLSAAVRGSPRATHGGSVRGAAPQLAPARALWMILSPYSLHSLYDDLPPHEHFGQRGQVGVAERARGVSEFSFWERREDDLGVVGVGGKQHELVRLAASGSGRVHLGEFRRGGGGVHLGSYRGQSRGGAGQNKGGRRCG